MTDTKLCECGATIVRQPNQNGGTWARVKYCHPCRLAVRIKRDREYKREMTRKRLHDSNAQLWQSSYLDKIKEVKLTEVKLKPIDFFISPGLRHASD